MYSHVYRHCGMRVKVCDTVCMKYRGSGKTLSKTQLVLRAAGAVVAVEVAGSIGALFTAPAVGSWYADIAKSSLTPPSWVFGPVWTILFALMGLALFLVWRKWRAGASAARAGLFAFAVQMVFNVLWSYFFFGLANPLLALGDIVLLWLAILATIYTFAKVSKPAAWLLAPYILWVSFAAYLNYTIVMLN